MKQRPLSLCVLAAASVIWGCAQEAPVSPPSTADVSSTAGVLIQTTNPFAKLVRESDLARQGFKIGRKADLSGNVALTHHRRSRRGEPVPIPGGLQVAPDFLIHTFLPGPVELGFMGEDIEPGVITDYSGFVAMAYLAGQATDADGNVYDMLNDIRVYRGKYIDEKGKLSRGTFCFI